MLSDAIDNRSPTWAQPTKGYPHHDSCQSNDSSIMHGVLQQLQLQKDFLRNQGRKGFRFHRDSNDYPALLTKYEEKKENATSDAE